jgi:type IV pilus assembly protein PilY1
MKLPYLTRLALLVFLVPQVSVVAEDIDLFVGAGPTVTNVPNVLLLLDNAANFSSNAADICTVDDEGDEECVPNTCVINGEETALSGMVGGIEQCALHQVISGLDVESVNIGVMVYNANNVVDYLNVECVGESNRTGGCLVYPIKSLTAENKAELLAWIEAWGVTDVGPGYIKADSEATGASMQEAWAYYAGRTGLSTRSYTQIEPANNGCQKEYLIFIGNSYSRSGSPGDQTGDAGPKDALDGTNSTSGMNADPAASTSEKALIGSTITTSCGTATLGNPHENKGYYADEWARYLNGQNITTYTIGVLGERCQADYAATLTSMATVGGGRYFPTTNFAELKTALENIFSELLSVNSVFASVSLPVSVNTEGTYLNQVYVGMFRPDGDAMARWAGNLKQYRMGLDQGNLKLLDAQDPAQPAVSSAHTGFIAECARSYWTPTPAGDPYSSYWTPFAQANCIGYPASSNTPDGNIVEKGGQGFMLRGSPTASSVTRNIKACNGTCSSELINFDTTQAAVITKALLGDAGMSDADQAALIDWGRGVNNSDDETYVAATAMRPSSHGDVVHSRPVAINFGSDASPSIVVFYGANDGALRAINGNRSSSFGGIDAGAELWSFIAPDFYGHLKRLRDNNTQISFFGNTTVSPVPLPKPYGFDGPITTYRNGSTAWIYATMRRGGRLVYAFDVSDIASDQTSPELKWRFGCPTGITCSGTTGVDVADIGQAWSSVKPLKAAGYNDGAGAALPMVIMGGGYDTCEDADPHTCSTTTAGDHIYVLDADTGTLLKTFDTDRAVVGDVFVIFGNTGLAQWAYAADLGGNVYRISGVDPNTAIGSTAPSAWTITKIASLGCATTASCTANRKFMFAPDVVEDDGYVLLIGSGDREKPLSGFTSAYAVSNHFFMLKDKPLDATWLTAQSANCGGSTLICLASLHHVDDAASPASTKGWYLDLAAHEQVVTSAITVYGVTTFSSHIPTVPVEGACSTNLGTARVYNIAYTDADPGNGGTDRYEDVAGGGLPPSPVAGTVILDSGQTVPFVIGADPSSPLEARLPPSPSPTTQAKGKIYWYIQQ